MHGLRFVPGRACLGYPCAAGLDDDQTWLQKNAKPITHFFMFGGLGLLVVLVFFMCIIYSDCREYWNCKETQEYGVWDT